MSKLRGKVILPSSVGPVERDWKRTARIDMGDLALMVEGGRGGGSRDWTQIK